MSILNTNTFPKDVVILQRDDANTYYGETHISGTDVIMYIDSAGYLNADRSASFYSTFPPPVSGLVPGNTYPITASWAESASVSISASYALTASWADRSFDATSASFTITASYAPVEPAYSASISTVKQNTLIVGSIYSITSSWSDNSINAITYSSSLAADKQDILVTGSTYPITASWALNCFTASYAMSTSIQTIETQSLVSVVSASWASSSVSSSYSPVQSSYSASVSTQFATKQNTLVAGLTYSITSSWANNSVSASFATSASWAPFQISASWASRSFNSTTSSFSSQSFSASYASFASQSFASTTASFASRSFSASFAESASWAPGSGTSVSASWASRSFDATSASFAITASYAPVQPSYSASVSTVKQNTLVTGNTYPITSSWAESSSDAISASYAPSLQSVSSSYALTASWAPDVTVTVDSASWASQSFHSTVACYSLTSSYALSALWAPDGPIPDYSASCDGQLFNSITSSYALTSSYSIQSVSSSYWSGSYGSLSGGDIIPTSDNNSTLGSLLYRWATAFITTISASYVYVANIFGGSNDGDSLTLKGSSTNTGSVYINPLGGQVIIGHTLYGNKIISVNTSSFTTALTVDVGENESVNLDMSLHGSWNSGGPIGYDVKMLLSKGNGSTIYIQPGVILWQNNYNSNNYATARIFDNALTSGSGSFQVQLISDGSNITNGELIYSITGNNLTAI